MPKKKRTTMAKFDVTCMYCSECMSRLETCSDCYADDICRACWERCSFECRFCEDARDLVFESGRSHPAVARFYREYVEKTEYDPSALSVSEHVEMQTELIEVEAALLPPNRAVEYRQAETERLRRLVKRYEGKDRAPVWNVASMLRVL